MPAVDRPQQEVLAYMGQLTEELLAVANAQVLAVYLHGSGTLGGWVANSSDVDVLVVLAEQVAPGPAGTLAEVAAATVRACPGTGLEMSIVCRDEAAAPRPPWSFVVHVNTANTRGRKVVLGQGHPGDPDLLLHYAVCRSSGWSVHGPPAADLIGPVPGTAVLDALAEELEWGLDNAPAPYALLNSCRALVYLHEGSLVAKTTGGQWALDRRVGPLDGVRRALAAQAGDLPAAVLTDADVEFIRRTAGRLRAAAAEEVTASASPRSARMDA